MDAATPPEAQSEERFRLLVESVRDYAIFMLDPEGRVTSWNVGAERLKGYRASEILGQHFSAFYNEDDRQRGHPAHELAHATAHGVYQEEGWRVRQDGSRFWASVVITAMRDATGALIGFAKVTRDLSERREADERLRRLNEDLEQRVRRRTAEIEAARAELETFSYSVSHDLRGPLRALDGFSRILLERLGPRLEDEDRDYLERIRAAAQRMAHLTDALLALSRLTRAPMQLQRVDLATVARAAIAELRAADPARTVELVLPDELVVQGDAAALRAVIDNLVQNAWKFTRRRPDARIELAAVDSADGPAYVVRDNGVGFDAGRADRLFIPFQRLHHERDFEGSGIGLATVARLVRRHGGRIWADSAPGAGAAFYFTVGEPDGT